MNNIDKFFTQKTEYTFPNVLDTLIRIQDQNFSDDSYFWDILA